MGTSKNKIHVQRTQVRRSRRAKSKEFSDKTYIIAKRTIMIVIPVAMLTVILGLLASFFVKPEEIIKTRISDIARDYYENYYYEKILDNMPSDKKISEVLKKYTETGFTEISLRQLVLFDSQRHAEVEATLDSYCDLDDTRIHFYPEEPFGVKDYRVVFKYACIF